MPNYGSLEKVLRNHKGKSNIIKGSGFGTLKLAGNKVNLRCKVEKRETEVENVSS